jgi:threonine dehydrogenase-like Zn-dependent dehydrogenase
MPRTLVLDGPRQLRLSDQPTRPLRAGEIRLRAMLSGISHGTELSLYRGTSAFTDKVFDRGLRAFVEPPAGSAAAYPVTLGYEMVAEVLEVAPDVTEVAVGDLVHTGTPHQEETVLDLASSLGATYPLVRLPTTERPERGLFISLAAVALQAVHDAEMKLGDAVSVHGLGTIGLLVVQMCRLEGIQNVFAIDPDPARRKLATGLGASHVLDPANGQAVGLQLRELNGGAGNVRLGEEFHHNRLSLIASIGAWGAPHRKAPLWNRRRVMDTATRLLYTDRVSIDGLLTRRFPFDQAPAAYRWIDEHPRAAVKVALTY